MQRWLDIFLEKASMKPLYGDDDVANIMFLSVFLCR